LEIQASPREVFHVATRDGWGRRDSVILNPFRARIRPPIAALIKSLRDNPLSWKIEHKESSVGPYTSISSRTDYRKEGMESIHFTLYSREILGVKLSDAEKRALTMAVFECQIAKATGQPTADGKLSLTGGADVFGQ
jgi:hypothetical protein